jgi:16S rRNA (cytidine1402-2'-O)-methyltransferase
MDVPTPEHRKPDETKSDSQNKSIVEPDLDSAHSNLPDDSEKTDAHEATGKDGTHETEELETTRSDRPLAPGLYLVGTPIGNLEDVTLRALRVLRVADRIACEDTRQTQKLLNHYGISTPTVSCHAHNENARIPELLALLREGGRVAVVSDAGMPGISDPGMHLASAALTAGYTVFPVPGANAALSALVASGLNTESFSFQGFLPEKAGARRTELERLAALAGPTTLIFYEAPHRILDTLADIASIWGANAKAALARELTKLHEEFLRGTAAEIRESLASRDRVRGEMVLLIEPAESTQAHESAARSISARVAELEKSEGLSEKDALKRVARERSLGKSEAYRELQRERSKPK